MSNINYDRLYNLVKATDTLEAWLETMWIAMPHLLAQDGQRLLLKLIAEGERLYGDDVMLELRLRFQSNTN